MSYVLTLPINNISRLLTRAYESKNEKKAWDLYLTKYPFMTQEDLITFEEFYKPGKINKVENKSETEILIDVKKILDDWHS